jgi:hypothetical protein
MSRDHHFSANSLEQARAIEAVLRRATGQIEEMSAVCEREIVGASAEIPDAIQEAANRLIGSWSRNDEGPVAPGQMARDVIAHFVQQQVKKLQDNLSTFAAQLQHDLQQCAFDLGLAHGPSYEEFQSVIRGTPVFDPQPCVIALPRPSFSRLVGWRFAKWQLTRQIKRQLGQSFQAGLDVHWRLLKEWSDSIIRQLKESFETYAESYRAQAEQLLCRRAFNPDELSAIQANLLQLDAGATAGTDVANSAQADTSYVSEASSNIV